MLQSVKNFYSLVNKDPICYNAAARILSVILGNLPYEKYYQDQKVHLDQLLNQLR